MSTPDIHLIAIDLDGTLLDDRKRISTRTVSAIANASARGIKVIIASARPPRSVRHIYAELGLDTWQINYNGALVWDEPGRAAVFHQPMDCRLVAGMIDCARGRRSDVLVSCEILDRWHTDVFDPRSADGQVTETSKLFRPDVVAPIETFCNQPITKLLLLGDAALMLELSALLNQQYAGRITIIQTEPQLLQITHTAASKAAALRIVAEHYGVALKHVMAIGDAANDIPMLIEAGVAVAMANAPAEVKAVAHWIAPSNNDEGVCAAMARFGLISQA